MVQDSDAPVNRLFREAISAHQAGKTDAAAALYRQVIEADPRHDRALHFLGLIEAVKGNFADARRLIETAIAVNAGIADYHFNLGQMLHDLALPDRALESFGRAVALDPDDPQALAAFASALHTAGGAARRAEVLAAYDRALAKNVRAAAVWYNRGNLLREMERPEDAVVSYDRALALAPKMADAWHNRGLALAQLRRLDAALASYEKALAANPAIRGGWVNRGNVLRQLRRLSDALASYDRELSRYPDDARVLYNKALTLADMKRGGEAAAVFARILELDPGFDYVPGQLLAAMCADCDWSRYEELLDITRRGIEQGRKVDVPFTNLNHEASGARQLSCARIYAADKYPCVPVASSAGDPHAHDRIRVAYLSPDFRAHAVAYLCAELLELHDRSRFEVFAVSFAPDDGSAIRARLSRAVDHFIDVSRMSDAHVAQLLREREIDIAVDMAGFTQGERHEILAKRPAPIQVNYLGYPGTTGSDAIDYIIADSFIIPPGHERYFSEKVIRLPASYQANDRRRAVATVRPTRIEQGLPDGRFVFCCMNGAGKITPEIFDVWMDLLAAIDGSVLWLLEASAAAKDNLRREAARRRIDPDRLVFAKLLPNHEHLARFPLADLFLDTSPYNAHTTASDALWMGLPAVTWAGDGFAARVCGSLLRAAGLPDLVTSSRDGIGPWPWPWRAIPSVWRQSAQG